MGLAALPGGGDEGYALAFAALMLACLLICVTVTARLGGALAAWLVALSPLVAGAVLRTHFDLLPTALVALALLALARERPTAGFALLGVGTMTKLFPALLVPVAAAWLVGRGDGRVALRGVGVWAGVCALVALPLAGERFLEQFTFHLQRPVQIESTPASVLWALGDSSVTGHPVRPDRFKSNGLDGGPADVVAGAFAVALAAVLAGVVALAARGGDVRRLVLCSFAAVLAFMALGKVLSPQFVAWTIPFAALAWAWRARVVALLVAAATALTLVEFPRRYFDLVAGDEAVVVLVAARNALLVAALVLLLTRLARAPARSPTPAGAPRSAPAPP